MEQFRRLQTKFPVELDAKRLADAERQVRDIVMRGIYTGRAPGAITVRFRNVGCAPGSRDLDDFFVEFAPFSGGQVKTLSVETFLATYRFFASDCA